jgi:hypothetical protein
VNYKDMTFCDYFDECKKGKKCNRACTAEVKAVAREKEQLLSLFYDKPACFRKINKKEDKMNRVLSVYDSERIQYAINISGLSVDKVCKLLIKNKIGRFQPEVKKDNKK